MSKSSNSNFKTRLLGCAALAAFTTFIGAGVAFADDDPVETIVVTGTRFNVDAAPAKASLTTTEPQTIINRTWIENYVPPQSDYVGILAIVPGLTGGDPNGPGLSDGGPKNTLRGIADGNFVIQYDGIPFGDTNGPTHHNISYFPASTIGSIDVDRGPGNAGNIGYSTYGGTVKFFSEPLSDVMREKVEGSYGSFDTTTAIANVQSGDLDAGDAGTLRVMTNLQYLRSDGALTGEDLFTNNALLKIEDQINANWMVTLFGDSSFLKEHLSDAASGLTPAQINTYGSRFGLQDNDPTLPTYQPYNTTSKHTDMDYLKVNGDLFGVKLENTFYTYAYWNHTFAPNNQGQTLADIQADTSQGNYTTSLPNGETANGVLTLANGTVDPNGILAYTKENAYRAYGNVLRLSKDYDFGWIDGQVRAGIWWERQDSHRYRYWYDMRTCSSKGVDPFDVGDIAANAACGDAYNPFVSSSYTGPGGVGNSVFWNTAKNSANVKTVEVGSVLGVNELGYSTYDEHSAWNQYEPFVEVDIKGLSDRLTVTPGLKYIHFEHGVDAPVEYNLCGVGANSTNTPNGANPPICNNALGTNYTLGATTRDLLPFLQANYKLQPSWSMYFEFAKGIYIPDLSIFENATTLGGFPAAETTTNYQLGTVYYADNFNFDADVYYIPIHNNYTSATCANDPSQTCYVNTGNAIYQGIEGEGTYAFTQEVAGIDLHGLSVFTNGALMSSKSGSQWVAGAPEYTLAGGVLYRNDGWKFGLIDKLIGSQYAVVWQGNQAETKAYEIHSYYDTTLTAGYLYEIPEVGSAELSLNVDNLFDRHSVTLIKAASSTTYSKNWVGNGGQIWQNSLNQYAFEAPRSIFVTLTLRH